MDWTSLGVQLAKVGAPMLASIFLGPAAGPLVGVLVDKISGALGVAPTPEAITAAIATDPAAPAKVQEVEATHADTIQAYLADVANARAMTVDLARAGSGLAYGPVVISMIVTGGFLGILLAMLALHLDGTNPITIAVLNVLVGTLGAGFAQVCNYWLGSTANSKARVDQVVGLAHAAVAAPSAALPRRK